MLRHISNTNKTEIKKNLQPKKKSTETMLIFPVTENETQTVTKNLNIKLAACFAGNKSSSNV